MPKYAKHAGLILIAWAAGWVYVHGAHMAYLDFSICWSQYDFRPIAPESERPIYWSISRHVIDPVVSGNWPEYLLWGAASAAFAILYAAAPSRRALLGRLPVLVISLLPLIYFGLNYEGWHHCDRKGSEFLSSAIVLWPWQVAIIGVGTLIRRLVERTLQ